MPYAEKQMVGDSPSVNSGNQSRFKMASGIVLVSHTLIAIFLGFASLIYLNPLTLLFAFDDPHVTSVAVAVLTLLKDAAPLIVVGPLTLLVSALFYSRGKFHSSLVVSAVTVLFVLAAVIVRVMITHHMA